MSTSGRRSIGLKFAVGLGPISVLGARPPSRPVSSRTSSPEAAPRSVSARMGDQNHGLSRRETEQESPHSAVCHSAYRVKNELSV